MLGFQRVVIADDQRGLQWRDGRLQQVLLPGAYTRFDPFSRVRIETCELSRPEVGLAKAEHYLRAAPAVLADHVEEVRMGNFELGLVRIEGKLAGFLAPGGKALYWRDSQPVTIERLNLQGDPALPASLVRELLSVDTPLQRVVSTLFAIQEVAVGQVGLLRSDGRIESVLTPGLYGFVRVSELSFSGSSLVLDPSEERMKEEFGNTQALHLPMHAVIRVEEVNERGAAKIRDSAPGEKVVPFQLSPGPR